MSTDIVQAVRAAGVVGAGGGGFPTHVKLDARADLVIANGAECEPLVYSDRTLMCAEPHAVVRGLRLAMRATGATRGLLAVKREAEQACRALTAALGDDATIDLAPLESYYPTGDEFVLVQTLTGRNVPEGGLPRDVGVLVHNVATLAQLAAAMDGAPVTERLVTVVGEVARPGIVRVPLGTRAREVIAWAGGLTQPEDDLALVAGGAMMGRLVDWDAPSIKTCGALMILPRHGPVVEMLSRTPSANLRRGRSTCDQCRDCTDLCPRHLLGHALHPHEIMRSINYGLDEPSHIITAAVLCSECRLCEAYACPLGLSPLAYYRACKIELQRQAWHNTIHRRSDVQPLPELGDRRVPVSRLTDRLGLSAYAEHAPVYDPVDHRPAAVTLLWKQHAGAPARPLVQVGQSVRRGDPLGEIPDGALGARVHASIDGVVTALDANAVILERRAAGEETPSPVRPASAER